MEKVKADYDVEGDTLYVYKEGPVAGSLRLGPHLILDFSPEDRPVGIEFLAASKILSRIANAAVPKAALSRITKAVLREEVSGDVRYLYYGIVCGTQGRHAQIVNGMLPLPRMNVARRSRILFQKLR